MAVTVTPEMDRRFQAMMGIVLDHLRKYQVFEQCAAKRVSDDLFRLSYPKKMAGQTSVIKVKFWTLDEPFVEITVMGRQQEDDKTGFQN